jgi:hypothetical protein
MARLLLTVASIAYARTGPLRIKYVYDASLEALGDARAHHVDELFPEAAAYLRRALTVNQDDGPLRIERSCNRGWWVEDSVTGCQKLDPCSTRTVSEPFRGETCGNVTIPEYLYKAKTYCAECSDATQPECGCEEAEEGEGVADADLLVFVTMVESEMCDSSAAHASSCAHDQFSDRPVVGMINLCGEVSARLILHELGHVLGFNSYDMAHWRDERGKARTPRNQKCGIDMVEMSCPLFDGGTENATVYWAQNTAEIFDGVSGVKRIRLTTPRALAVARDYFACPTLEGIEVQQSLSLDTGDGISVDGADPLCNLAHLEARVLGDAIMAYGGYDHHLEAKFTAVELALLEDSQWYGVDFGEAARPGWGYKAGCSFVTEECILNGVPVAHPFCIEAGPGCTADYRATAWCGVESLSKAELESAADIPKRYQYFDDRVDDPMVGLSESFDYCPHYEVATYALNSVSIFSGAVESSVFGECTDDTACFAGYSAQSDRADDNAACFSYSCDSCGHVVVNHDREQLTCESDGQRLVFSDGVEITCSPRRFLCGDSGGGCGGGGGGGVDLATLDFVAFFVICGLAFGSLAGAARAHGRAVATLASPNLGQVALAIFNLCGDITMSLPIQRHVGRKAWITCVVVIAAPLAVHSIAVADAVAFDRADCASRLGGARRVVLGAALLFSIPALDGLALALPWESRDYDGFPTEALCAASLVRAGQDAVMVMLKLVVLQAVAGFHALAMVLSLFSLISLAVLARRAVRLVRLRRHASIGFGVTSVELSKRTMPEDAQRDEPYSGLLVEKCSADVEAASTGDVPPVSYASIDEPEVAPRAPVEQLPASPVDLAGPDGPRRTMPRDAPRADLAPSEAMDAAAEESQFSPPAPPPLPSEPMTDAAAYVTSPPPPRQR